MSEKAQVTLNLLKELGCDGIPIVTVLNKCDKQGGFESGGEVIKISAKTGEGIDNMLEALQRALRPTAQRMKVLLPYDKSGLVNKILSCDGKIFLQEYTENGILLDALIDNTSAYIFEEYRI